MHGLVPSVRRQQKRNTRASPVTYLKEVQQLETKAHHSVRKYLLD
jgi:hypothetical protein